MVFALVACVVFALALLAGARWWRESAPDPESVTHLQIAPPGPAPRLDPTQVASAAPELGLTVESYPKVDGSTSAQPLLMMTACKILRAQYGWVYDESNDSRQLHASWMAEMMAGLATESESLCNQINQIVHSHGTGEAFVNLIKKNADLILTARLPSDDELRLATELGVELDARPVALDAFVFLLNGENPVASLTIEQIRGIYSGRIINWRQVGGPDAAIQPYQRTRNSGSQELMQKLVMKQSTMIKAPDLLIGAIMSSPFLAIGKDTHGIGYSVYFYQEFMAPPSAIKACAVEGVLPTPETIGTRRYPLVTEVYAVVRRDSPADHAACRVRDWMLKPAGQRVVGESGYVPVPVR